MTYLLSNIKSSKPIPNLDPDNDELVFLNKAVNWENYKNVPCLKYLYCRARAEGGYWVRPEWKGKELQFFNRFQVLDVGWRFFYTDGKTPTTGFWVWNILKEQGKDIVLVNFMPDTDFSTTHWGGHDWKFESDTYKREKPKTLVIL